MPTLEERVQALEKEIVERKRSEEILIQEIVARKQAEEMLTIAVRALVSKEAFEKLQGTVEKLQETLEESQERNGKLFNVIINQNTLHNERVKDFPAQLTNHDKRIAELDGKVVGLQTEMRQRFTGVETMLSQILARLPEKP